MFAYSIIIIAALLPTLLWSLLFAWADRYEREPRRLVFVAFVWGALPAIVLSILAEVLIGAPFVADGDGLAAELVSGALVAPVVEEIAKAAVMVFFYMRWRQEFDGVLDGIVYGALIGFGFAMTENLFYFVGAYDEGGLGSLTALIYLRAVVFGLNHAFYTALFGMGLGMARNSPTPAGRLLWPMAGLIAAILVHGLHNFGVAITPVSGWGVLLSLALAAAGLGLFLLTVLLSWRAERDCIRNELAGEVGGLLSSEEFVYLSGRWHRPLRPRNQAQRDQANRLQLCVELAFRQRRLRLHGEGREPGLVKEVADLRAQLAAGLVTGAV